MIAAPTIVRRARGHVQLHRRDPGLASCSSVGAPERVVVKIEQPELVCAAGEPAQWEVVAVACADDRDARTVLDVPVEEFP